MAVVLMDGFDHYSNVNAVEKFWNGSIFAMVPGRGFGGQAMDVIINNGVSKVLPSSYSTIIFGAAIQVSDNSAGEFMQLQASGIPVASVALNSGTMLLEVLDSTGALIGTGTTVIPTHRWFYVELKVIVGGSGHATLHLNGGAEIASSLGNFGSADITQIRFDNHSLGGDTLVDDVVVLDTSGSSPQNDFLGDVRVKPLYPIADATYTDWTPDTGTDHYSRVNEHLIDGDASYVKDANPTDKDSYKMDTFIGVIYAAQLNIGARKGEAALRQLKPLIRQSGTDYLGDLATLSTDYLFYSWILDNDPSGSPWLAATINADEFGQELIT